VVGRFRVRHEDPGYSATVRSCFYRYPGDLLGADYHEVRVAKNPVQIEGPITTIGELPGLGVEVDWNLVRNLQGSLAE